MKNILLVIVGETYRHRWPTNSNLDARGSQESYELQMLASNSHLEFIKTLEKRNNIRIEILLYFYSLNKDWDEKYIQKYKDYLSFTNILYENRIGEQALQNKLINFLKDKEIDIKYDSILFIRPDLYLKKYFSDVFDINEKRIMFPHVNEIVSTNNHCGCRKSNTLYDIRNDSLGEKDMALPAVSHQIFYVPKKFFNILLNNNIWRQHFSYYECLKYLDKEEIGFFINTFHSSCTSLTWNPIYSQVNRQQCEKWPDEELYFDYHSFSVKKSTFKQYKNLSRKKEY